MRTTFISLGSALLIAAVVWVSIIFLDPGMNLDKAYNILAAVFIGSAVGTSLLLGLWKRHR